MGAVLYRFRSELRTRWRAWLGLALLIGIAAGAVIAMVAGAIRTDTAYSRFLREQRAFDAVAQCPTGAGAGTCDLDALRAVPQVEGAGAAAVFGGGSAVVRTERGRLAQPDANDPSYTGPGEVQVVVAADRRFGTDVDRLKILDGRRPDPSSPDEAAVNFALANRLGLEVGDRLLVRFPDDAPARAPATVEIVGIEVAPFEVPPTSGQWEANVHLTPAFHRRAKAQGWLPPDEMSVRLRPGADVAELRAALERRGLAFDVFASGSGVFGSHDGVQRSIRPQAVALWIVAALTLLAALAVFGQVLARLTFLESGDLPTLRSLGLGRVQLWSLGLLRAGGIGGAAAAVAVAATIGASPLTPIGLARTVEPHSGFSLDARALLLGAIATVVLVVLLAAVPAWRLAGVAGTSLDTGAFRRRPSTIATTMARWSMPPAAVTGARMALEPGRGRTAVPVRSSIAGISVGLLALMAALTFSQSLDRLLATPALSGWNWDVAALVPYDDAGDEPTPRFSPAALRSAFRSYPAVNGLAFGTYFRPFPVPDYALALGPAGVKVDILTFGPGQVGPTVLDGRAPGVADEILLGPDTLEELGLDVGDRVRAVAHVPDAGDSKRLRKVTARLRIVGTGVVPLSGGTNRLGRGATLTLAGAQALNPAALPDVIWLRLAPGSDPVDVVRDVANRLGVKASRRQAAGSVIGFQFSSEVLNVKSVDQLPLALAALMALMAVGVLAHVLVTGVRSRRRDLAILSALGFRRRQVRASLAWQATTTVGVALLVAIPLGIVAGGAIWHRYAQSIGVVPSTDVPWLDAALVALATLVIANVVAAVPARTAARTRSAVVLRSE